jgi:hypothetical protein
VLAHIKCNVGPHSASLIYQVRPIVLPHVGEMPEMETSRLELVGESSHTGDSLLTGEAEREALNEAEEFLLDLLSDGTRHAAADIYREAARLHISPDRLKRARRKIGGETAKAGFGRGWEWWLPDSNTKSALAGRATPSHSSTPFVEESEESTAPFPFQAKSAEESEESTPPREDTLRSKGHRTHDELTQLARGRGER